MFGVADGDFGLGFDSVGVFDGFFSGGVGSKGGGFVGGGFGFDEFDGVGFGGIGMDSIGVDGGVGGLGGVVGGLGSDFEISGGTGIIDFNSGFVSGYD